LIGFLAYPGDVTIIDMVQEKKRILYVEENRDGTVGGSHFQLLDIVQSLDASRFTPYVLFYENNKLISLFVEAGARVSVFVKPKGINLVSRYELVKRNRVLGFLLRLVQICLNIVRSDIYSFIYANYFLLRRRIKVVHMNDTVFSGLEWVLACRMLGRKIIAHERGVHETIPPFAIPNSIVHTRLFHVILGVSKSTKKNLQHLGVDVTRRYYTFYDRVKVEKFALLDNDQEQKRKELCIPARVPLVGIVGNIKRWKGQLVVVRAINEVRKDIPDIRCLIVGDHSTTIEDDVAYYEEIKDLITELSLEEAVLLTGFRDDGLAIMAILDVVVHASISPEPWGMVVLEAMGLGKAVIASSQGGPVEMIKHGVSGLLSSPGDVKELATNIKTILSDEAMKNQLGKNAEKRVVKKFSELDMDFLQSLYDDLACNKV